MDTEQATELIRSGVPASGGTWADFGAGTGAFSRALAALLGPGGRVLAVDRDAEALRGLDAARDSGSEARGGAEIVAVRGDFRDLEGIRELAGTPLDGALFANSLHFAADAERVLRETARRLAPGGRIVVVEYDGRAPSRWVPYPIPRDAMAALAARAGLAVPRVVGERPSRYGGLLYAAVLAPPSG